MTRTRSVLFALVAALALLGSGADASAAPAPLSSQTFTHQQRVRPVTAAGVDAPGYTVARTFHGATCSPGSDQVRGAYRCFAGNDIFDPCWAEAAAAPQVLCLLRPWAHVVYRLQVKGSLTATPAGGPQPVWGLTVAGGNRCVEIDAARDRFDGRSVNYACSYGLVVLGAVNDTHRVWTVATARFAHGHYTLTGTRTVVTAWFARPSIHV